MSTLSICIYTRPLELSKNLEWREEAWPIHWKLFILAWLLLGLKLRCLIVSSSHNTHNKARWEGYRRRNHYQQPRISVKILI